MPEYVQETLGFLEERNEDPSETNTLKEVGSRITPSSLETIIHYHYHHKRLQNELKLSGDLLEKHFLSLLNKGNQFEEEKVVENAKDSIKGTQLHNLAYSFSLFSRAAYFNRQPNLEDIKTTFPFKDKDYHLALLKVLEISEEDFLSNDPLDNAQNFWNKWRLNGQNFFPKGKKYILPGSKIKKLWEADLISLDEISQMRESFLKEYKDFNPAHTLVMNEVPLTLNTYFGEKNFQICTSIDEIRISPFSNPPIHVIDYKTGKQFKEPEYIEELQIFLMLVATYIRFVDDVNTLNSDITDWDLMSNEEVDEIKKPLHFKNKSNLKKGNNVRSVENWQIPSLPFDKFIEFSYIDPITQREFLVNLKRVGLKSEEEIQKRLSILDSYHDFYLRYKHKGMMNKINGCTGFYTLPKFPTEEFIKKDLGLWDKNSHYYIE
jgi:hypothetical protein